jgi:hypothetical protein
VLHGNLVLDDQVRLSQDRYKSALLRDTAYGRLVELDRDLKLGMRRSPVRQQEGRDTRRCNTEDRLPLAPEVEAEGLIEKRLTGPPRPL